MNKKKIRNKVYEFRKEYDLQEVNYDSLSLVVQKLGYVLVDFSTVSNDSNTSQLIDALGLSEQVQSQRGFTYADGDMRILFINEALSEQEKLIVLSHELGHIVLGHFHKSNIIGNDVTDEFEANEFSALLINPSLGGKALFYLLSHKKIVAIASGCVAAVALLVVATCILLPKQSTTYASGTEKIISKNEEEQELPEETLAEDEVIETSIETDPVTGETHVVYNRVTKAEQTNASDDTDASSSTTSINKETTKSEKKVAETTASYVTNNKFYIIDDCYMNYNETVRGDILDDLMWFFYKGDNFTYSSYTFGATSDGGVINVYLTSEEPDISYYSSSYDETFKVLKDITENANEFSKLEPAWTRTNYYACVYSGDSSQRLICKILNGNIVYSE